MTGILAVRGRYSARGPRSILTQTSPDGQHPFSTCGYLWVYPERQPPPPHIRTACFLHPSLQLSSGKYRGQDKAWAQGTGTGMGYLDDTGERKCAHKGTCTPRPRLPCSYPHWMACLTHLCSLAEIPVLPSAWRRGEQATVSVQGNLTHACRVWLGRAGRLGRLSRGSRCLLSGGRKERVQGREQLSQAWACCSGQFSRSLPVATAQHLVHAGERGVGRL